ncbi:uncharacterized protein LOC126897773 [Daktulosphaira vitifoliae]|uniref:uncharacterized protein LOC126897773 n=1 Tax=Daktulosphaira vitifoliae TaxID=58002 RepID=UPI0021AAD2AA|nr:uncharacterized protein LOC126897773 [Daktulosphaira vitifoliae]XP_050527595.1 uncharacterized protein LOC126897773 [Daktulosphaira vitifoliae]XP_050527596.1 uncharacterized protein LOC126897773 [Daktulosphaira vitifoliae]
MQEKLNESVKNLEASALEVKTYIENIIRKYHIFSVFCINHWHFNEILEKKTLFDINPPPIFWNNRIVRDYDLFDVGEDNMITEENFQDKSAQLYKMLTGIYIIRLINILKILEHMCIGICEKLDKFEYDKGEESVKAGFNCFEESINKVSINISKNSIVPNVVNFIINDIVELKINKDLNTIKNIVSTYIEKCYQYLNSEYYMSEYEELDDYYYAINRATYVNSVSNKRQLPLITLRLLLDCMKNISQKISKVINILS